MVQAALNNVGVPAQQWNLEAMDADITQVGAWMYTVVKAPQ